MPENNTTRTRNLDASKARRTLIAGLTAEGFVKPEAYTVTLLSDKTDEATGKPLTRTLPLTDFVGITEAEIKGPKVPTPKPVTVETLTLALDAGTLSTEDLEKLLKERKKK